MSRGPWIVAATAALLFAGMMMAPPASAQWSPWITNITPDTAMPGDEVDVEGYYLDEVTYVYVGSYSVDFEIVSENLITLEVPSIPEASYDVMVRASGGDDTACCLSVEHDAAATTTSPTPTSDTTGTTTPTSSAGATVDQDTTACEADGRNVECGSMGRIAMDARHEIRGEAIDVPIDIRIDRNYEDAGAEWMLFSIRDTAPTGDSPVEISLVSLHTEHGEIALTREEQPSLNELNLWANVFDVPTDTDITLTVNVGATEKGAFQIEVLVMPFDGAYGSVLDGTGEPVSLYSFTLLGVNEESARFGGVPTLGAILGSRWGIASLAAAAALLVGLLLLTSRARARRMNR